MDRRLRTASRSQSATRSVAVQSEELPHVFEEFRQANPRLQTLRRCPGLGVAIARRLAGESVHGGERPERLDV